MCVWAGRWNGLFEKLVQVAMCVCVSVCSVCLVLMCVCGCLTCVCACVLVLMSVCEVHVCGLVCVCLFICLFMCVCAYVRAYIWCMGKRAITLEPKILVVVFILISMYVCCTKISVCVSNLSIVVFIIYITTAVLP